MSNNLTLWQSTGSDAVMEQMTSNKSNSGFGGSAPDTKFSRDGKFIGTALDLRYVTTKQVQIQSHPSVNGEIRVKALFDDQDEFDRLVVTEGDRVAISQRPDANSGGSFGNVYVNVSNAFIVNGRVVSGGHVGTSSKPPSLVLLIIVPPNCPLRIKTNGVNNILIGDIAGPMAFDINGQNQITVGSASDLDLDVNGQSSFTIGHLSGKTDFDLNGQTDVLVNSGTVSKLNVDANGMASFTFNGTAQRANLDANGMSKINVYEVLEDLDEDANGMSRISVSRRPVSSTSRRSSW